VIRRLGTISLRIQENDGMIPWGADHREGLHGPKALWRAREIVLVGWPVRSMTTSNLSLGRD